MSTAQLEFFLGAVAYICVGTACNLWFLGSPSELLKEAAEKDPAVDAADAFKPALVRGVVAFLWCVGMLVWPVELASYLWACLLDGMEWAVGKLEKLWKRKDKEDD